VTIIIIIIIIIIYLLGNDRRFENNKCNGDTTEQDSKANYIALTAARKNDRLVIRLRKSPQPIASHCNASL